MLYEASLSVTDASGRQISLLNSDSVNAQTNVRTTPSTTAKHPPAHWQSHQRSDDNDSASQQQQQQQQRQSRRKYHCSEPGCNKSFTTRYVGLDCVQSASKSTSSISQRPPGTTQPNSHWREELSLLIPWLPISILSPG